MPNLVLVHGAGGSSAGFNYISQQLPHGLNILKADHLITMSAPWQGSPFARWLKFVVRNNKLFNHMNPGSEFLEYLHEKTFLRPHTNIITVGGGNEVAAWGKRDNDGTVTVDSQVNVPTGFIKSQNEFINLSHTEILQSSKVCELITGII